MSIGELFKFCEGDIGLIESQQEAIYITVGMNRGD